MKAKRIIPTLPPPPPDEIQLTLSVEEARLLRNFAGSVAAPTVPENRSYYKLFSNIYTSLGSVNVPVSKQGFVALNGALDYIEIVDYKQR